MILDDKVFTLFLATHVSIIRICLSKLFFNNFSLWQISSATEKYSSSFGKKLRPFLFFVQKYIRPMSFYAFFKG